MTEEQPHVPPEPGAPAPSHGEDHAGPTHGSGDHGDDGGHDDHGHAEEPLGPVDVAAWGAGAVGVAVAVVTAVCFALATGWISTV